MSFCAAAGGSRCKRYGANLPLGDFAAGRQLRPAEEKGVGDLAEWIQIDEPHPPLANGHTTKEEGKKIIKLT